MKVGNTLSNILLTAILCCLNYYSCISQNIKVEPPFWYSGMKNPNLQIMLYGENIQSSKVDISSNLINLVSIDSVKNVNYLFINLDISKSGNKQTSFNIEITKPNSKTISIDYNLKPRNRAVSEEPLTSKDVVYLITPDRFANGDTTNDIISGMLESTISRSDKWARHGGDLQGIIDQLPYLQDLGVDALWLNPILENNQPQWSYHGYAITDLYKVDPRFGSNELYQKLSQKASELGIGIIMDMVANHIGHKHWWMNDLPSDDWINGSPTAFEVTNHKKSTLLDPYASEYDKKLKTDGWFVPTMPDLNQRNPILATYLIQNSIWWIEYANLKGIRQDTYSYPDKDFMTKWSCAILNEYPEFYIVGEAWSLDPGLVAYWQRGNTAYESCLRSTMDFPMNAVLADAFMEDENWNTGLVKIYEVLMNDSYYPNANDMMIFPDNHDMSRIYTQVNENLEAFKMSLTYIMTTRGIPQLYYGTEVLMSHLGDNSHGQIRSDFPGGWSGNEKNAFSGEGLSTQEKETQAWLRELMHWRRTKEVIHSGKILHFAPVDGTYTFFRYNEKEAIMVIYNKNENETTVDLNRYLEILDKYTLIKERTESSFEKIANTLNLNGKSATIFELK